MGIVVLLALAVAIVAVRQRRLGRRIEALTRGGDGASLEAILADHLERVHGLARDVERLATRSARHDLELQRAFQRIGVVRFNPFGDTGGNQSFVIALLDGKGDGVVVSSLHARGGTRIYARAVTGGRTDGAASEEEAEALRQAMGRPPAGGGG